MTVIDIVMNVLMWPSVVVAEVTGSPPQYLSAAVGLGIPLYFLGMPSAEMSGMELAQWYGLTGASVVGVHYLMVDKATTYSDARM